MTIYLKPKEELEVLEVPEFLDKEINKYEIYSIIMKKLIFSCCLLFCVNFYAQEKETNYTDVACDCVSNIDLSKSKEEKIEEIKSCISNALIQKQILSSLTKVADSIKKREDLADTTQKNIDVVIDDRIGYEALEKDLLNTCEALNKLYFSNDIKTSDASVSDKKKAINFYNLGIQGLDKEDYETAIQYFKKAVKADKNFAFAWDNLAISYRRLEKYPEAIKYYKKSLKIDPKGKMPLMNLGLTYGLNKEYDKAIEAYDNFKEIYPDDPEAYFGVGRIYLLQNNLEQGLDNMMKAYVLYIKINSPYKADAQKYIVQLYATLKEQNKLDIFNRLAEKNKIQIQN